MPSTPSPVSRESFKLEPTLSETVEANKDDEINSIDDWSPKIKSRWRFSKADTRILEKFFDEDPNPMQATLDKVAKQLQSPRKTVTTWFQNRRAKERRIQKRSQEQVARVARSNTQLHDNSQVKPNNIKDDVPLPFQQDTTSIQATHHPIQPLAWQPLQSVYNSSSGLPLTFSCCVYCAWHYYYHNYYSSFLYDNASSDSTLSSIQPRGYFDLLSGLKTQPSQGNPSFHVTPLPQQTLLTLTTTSTHPMDPTYNDVVVYEDNGRTKSGQSTYHQYLPTTT